MGGTWQPAFDRVPKRRNLRIDRETLFVTCDIESGDAASLETFDKSGRLESLRGAEMPQGAQDQTGFDPGGTNACFGCAVDRSPFFLAIAALFSIYRIVSQFFLVALVAPSPLTLQRAADSLIWAIAGRVESLLAVGAQFFSHGYG